MNNITAVLNILFKELKISVTSHSIKKEISQHPNASSLAAVSDLLDNWQVPHVSCRLSIAGIKEKRVTFPFIAYYDHDFVVVNHIDDGSAIISDEIKIKRSIPIAEFEKYYKGVILVARKGDNSGETNYIRNYRVEKLNRLRLPLLSIAFIAFLIGLTYLDTAYIRAISFPQILITLIKTAGLCVSILLLIQTIDNNNPLVQRFCGDDKSKNCNAILSSKAAKLTEYMSWSEIGFYYFAGTWLAFLFNSGNRQIVDFLFFLNVLSLPYTVYSIYYQGRIAKQWCIFCCIIQGLLWFEFFAFTSNTALSVPHLDGKDLLKLVICLFLPIHIWMLLKPFFLQSQKVQPLTDQMNWFKFNQDFFNKLLTDEIKYSTLPKECSLIIGNQDAENVITIVTNPFCQPCAKAHRGLDEWVSKRDDIKLQLVFSTYGHEKDPRSIVASHFLAIRDQGNPTLLKNAVDSWYSQDKKDFKKWSQKYPANGDFKKQILVQQKEWCRMVEITETPTVFINGRKLPNAYKPEDIKYFI